MSTNSVSLWREPHFLTFWLGQTISQFGSQITYLALPLIASLWLDATPAQMGILVAAETAPLLLSLFAGVWIDRRRRRPLLLATDWLRAALLLAIPIAAWSGVLSMPLLYVIAFVLGVLTVMFDVAYQSFLPTLVGREQLIDGNSKLEISRSAAQIVGPGLAGVLVQLFSAPFTLVMDGLSFVASALCIGAIRRPEPAPVAPTHGNVWRDIADGLRVVLAHPIRRALVGCAATGNIAHAVAEAVFLLYVTRTLELAPSVVGGLYALGNIGFLLGALLATPLARQWGLGRTLLGVVVLDGLGVLCLPLAADASLASLVTLALGRFLIGFAGTVFTIHHVSLRQAITPDRVQGRMNATVRFIAGGVVPLGALVGGAIGTAYGVRAALLVGAVGAASAFMWLWASPVRALRSAELLTDAQ